ncbi:hypothetical protein MNBD_GAMMA23-221 [hydrothermal vent metagenome]|uniref:DUF4266 domain-containing protein n=1 Tax=hydrothermal vent metagenome TaxID=652676 RepID=A0A3B0ZSG1_9ZZZZ
MHLLFKQKILKPVLVAAFILITTGCSSLEPWVQPYEREILADPVMSFAREPAIENHFAHVYEVREGSHGAGSGIGGGCGCN